MSAYAEDAQQAARWALWVGEEADRLRLALEAAYEDNRALSERLLALEDENARYRDQLTIKENDMHKVQLYRDESGDWRWRRVAANGEIVADSAEGYTNSRDAREMAEAVNGGEYVIEEATQ